MPRSPHQLGKARNSVDQNDSWRSTLKKFLEIEISAATDEQLSAAVAKALRADEFKTFRKSPRGDFPVAVLPARSREGFPQCRLLVLTERVACKMTERHSDVSVGDFERLPRVLADGEMFKDGDRELVRIFFWRSKNKNWWRLVVWFESDAVVARLVTFHKSTKRAFLKMSTEAAATSR